MNAGTPRPNFLFIGPDKSGSTWLYQVLSSHPQVFMSRAKELFYFDYYHHLGDEWYLSHFGEATDQHRVIGEISHDYLFSVEAAERICALLPDVRLMVCLREPVERAFSAWLYMRKQGRTQEQFSVALETIGELVEHGLYARHLQPYYEMFGRDRVYTALFDDLRADPEGFARGVFDFLQIAPMPLSAELTRPSNRASEPRHFGLARVARRAGTLVRSMGKPEIVTAVKSSRLVQRTLYRTYRDGEKPVLAPEERDRLKALFRDDVYSLAEISGIDVVSRWGYADVPAPRRSP